MKFYASVAMGVQSIRYMFLPVFFLPLTTEKVHVFARVRLFVCLSVCWQDYLQTRPWIWIKCSMLTDVGT